MGINAQKTKEVTFSSSRALEMAPVTIGVVSLRGWLKSKLLGVTLCAKPKWTKHIDCVITRYNQGPYLLLHLKRSGCLYRRPRDFVQGNSEVSPGVRGLSACDTVPCRTIISSRGPEAHSEAGTQDHIRRQSSVCTAKDCGSQDSA